MVSWVKEVKAVIFDFDPSDEGSQNLNIVSTLGKGFLHQKMRL